MPPSPPLQPHLTPGVAATPVAVPPTAAAAAAAPSVAAAGVPDLYGGEANEAIRFMEPAPTETEELEDEERTYVGQLEAALRALRQHALVTGVNVYCNDDGSDPQKRGVSVTLNSTFLAKGKQRSINIHCSEKEGRKGRKGEPTAPKPTQLHAARAALEQLMRDYDAELAAAAAAGSPQAEQTAFDVMRAATLARKGLEQYVAAATVKVTGACDDERAKVLEREAAETELREAKAALEAFGPSKKKQKTTAGSSGTAAAGGTAASGEAATATAEQEAAADEPFGWLRWPLSRWRKHEREDEHRRAVPLEPFIGPLPAGVKRGPKGSDAPMASGSASLPRGDEKRGWRWHRRRGVFGNLRSWANGNRSNVAIMLADSALYFGVVEEVTCSHSARALARARARTPRSLARIRLCSPSLVLAHPSSSPPFPISGGREAQPQTLGRGGQAG